MVIPKTRPLKIQDCLSILYEVCKNHSDTPMLDSQVLVAHILKKPRVNVMAHPELSLTSKQRDKFKQALIRLNQGVPLPYVLGNWEFFGLDFIVSHETLIPRPETELLVEHAEKWLRAHSSRRLVADVGSGSGIIGISLAVRNSYVHVFCSDLSWPALKIAQLNSIKHHVSDRVDFIQCDLLSAAQGSFDLICANLPYLPTDRMQSLEVSHKEPWLALDGGRDGSDHLRKLLKSSTSKLAPRGLMLLEIDASQGRVTSEIAKIYYPGANINLYKDLSGRDRLLSIDLPE